MDVSKQVYVYILCVSFIYVQSTLLISILLLGNFSISYFEEKQTYF